MTSSPSCLRKLTMALINIYVVAIAVPVGIGLWLAALVISRYFFHPLSKYPGPFWNAVSGLPVARWYVSGRHHAYFKAVHDKYGTVVRVAPNELSFCSAGAWEDIYGFRSYDEPMEKDRLWVGALMTLNGSTPITYANRADHGRQRRAFSHSFSNTTLKEQEPLIRLHIHKLVDRLAELGEAGKPANIKDWYIFSTLDIIGDLYFGSPFGCLDLGTGTEWSRGLMAAQRCGLYEQATRRVGGHDTWLQRKLVEYVVPATSKQGKLTHYLNSKDKTMERLQDEQSEHRDFIYYILRNNEAKKLLTPTEIILNSSVFIGAASDTTATTLTALTYLILTHPEAYNTLVAEIREQCATVEDINFANIKDLEYLGAVINESLRMFSPVTPGFLRTVPPNGQGAMIDNNYVAPGVTVSVHQWAASHSNVNWTRPGEFLPERWLRPDDFPHDKRHAMQPFSMGPRGCIGKNLANMELRLFVAQLLWTFDMELEGGKQGAWRWDPAGEMKHIKAYMTFERPDLWVKVKKVAR